MDSYFAISNQGEKRCYFRRDGEMFYACIPEFYQEMDQAMRSSLNHMVVVNIGERPVNYVFGMSKRVAELLMPTREPIYHRVPTLAWREPFSHRWHTTDLVPGREVPLVRGELARLAVMADWYEKTRRHWPIGARGTGG